MLVFMVLCETCGKLVLVANAIFLSDLVVSVDEMSNNFLVLLLTVSELHVASNQICCVALFH